MSPGSRPYDSLREPWSVRAKTGQSSVFSLQTLESLLFSVCCLYSLDYSKECWRASEIDVYMNIFMCYVDTDVLYFTTTMYVVVVCDSTYPDLAAV